MLDILGYEGYYRITEDGAVYSVRANRFIKPFHKNGNHGEKSYLRIPLQVKSKKKKFFVHRLVAYTYIGQPLDDEYVVNHKDGNKLNNHYTNLEWVTKSENNYHAIAIGLSKGYNGTKQKRNTSGYVGVTHCGNRWKAQIRIKNELIYLGLYDTKVEASNAYWGYLNSLKKK